MSHQDKWEKDGLYRHFTGKVSGEEILDANLNIQGDVRFLDIKYVINDFTQTTEFDSTKTDVAKIVTFDNVVSISKKQLKIAIVATLDSLLPWVNLYCEKMQNAPYDVKVFDNMNDALQWASL